MMREGQSKWFEKNRSSRGKKTEADQREELVEEINDKCDLIWETGLCRCDQDGWIFWIVRVGLTYHPSVRTGGGVGPEGKAV